MSKGILLEAGTNEMELLLFQVGSTDYGINVVKVREIIRQVPTVSIPGAPEAIVGSFKLREEVLTLVGLARCLQVESAAEVGDEDRLIIVIEFNELRCGILVDSVEMIHRLRWENIEPPSGYLTQYEVPVTSVARIGERVVMVLDFETIIGRLLGQGEIDVPEPECVPEEPSRANLRLLVADDSRTIRESVDRLLRGAGFTDVTICGDGQEAWDRIDGCRQAGEPQFDLVLTDVEMPRMDGLHLTARIKKDSELQHIPVVLFSSIVRSDNTAKGESVGADAQITKFKREDLLEAIDGCIAKLNAN